MENTKVLNLFFETGNVLIRLVQEPGDADVVLKEDGSIELSKVKKSSSIPSGSNNSSIESKKLVPEVVEEDLETTISKTLLKLGIPVHIKGYRYVREAIKIVVEEPEIINAVTKKLYPKVGKCYDTTPSRTERAIRHAIEVSVERGDKELHQKLFTYSPEISKKIPTNSEFIASLADYFRRLKK